MHVLTWVLWEADVIRCARALLRETPVNVKEVRAREMEKYFRLQGRSATFEGEGEGRGKKSLRQ